MRVSRRTRIGLLTVLLAALFVFALKTTHRNVVMALNRQALSGIAQSMLSRAEITADYAVIKLVELYEKGNIDCDQASISALNLAVFQAGAVKDILISTHGQTCSVASFSDVLQQNNVAPFDGAFARNNRMALNSVDMNGVPALALTWTFSPEMKASVLVSTENLVFDVLSNEYREEGMITIALSDGRKIASFTGPDYWAAQEKETFSATSDRYPLVARIEVPSGLLASSSIQRSPGVMAAAIAVSLLLGYLVARGLFPPTGAAARIRQALASGEIVPHFQPVYDLRSGRMSGFEALARWPGMEGPIASPAVFVPIIEANGWANDLLEAVIEETARSMRPVIQSAPEVTFAFNATSSQFVDPEFPTWLAGVLERTGLDAGRTIIELTEREELREPANARRTIEALGAMGIEVAIDDTGTGHNGLASIQRLGVAILKIDKLFVDALEQDPHGGAVVQMLVNIAREFDMRTIAEGVESESQLAALRRIGVDEVQGFFLSKPLDAETAATELARHQVVLLRQKLRDDATKEPATRLVAVGA
ncbi:MAG: EAL domain-containing protein [Oricola sp.]